MIVTVQDPPAFNIRGLLVIAGVIFAILAVLQVPIVRQLPIGLVLFCLAALSGGFVVRGAAYPGRFSLQLIPVAITVTVCCVGLLSGARRFPEVHHE